jgi:O-antigen ligase
VIPSISLPHPDLSSRRTQLLLGSVVLAAVVAGIAVQIGLGDLRLALLLAGFLASPVLIWVALRWPYIFPYGLYVMLVPFDNMLKIGGSGTLTKLLGILAVVAIGAHAFVMRRSSAPPRALWIWIGFLLWTLMGIMWSPDVPAASLLTQTLASLVLLYAVLSVAPVDEHDLRTICMFIVLGGVAASVYGMYVIHTSPQMTGDFGRLMITIGDRTIDPNHFANSLLAPIALAFVTLTSSRRPAVIFGALVALAILLGGVLISLSREALLGSVIVVAVVIALSRHRIVGALIALPVLITVPLLVPAIGQRMAEAFVTGGAGRASLWHVAWTSIQQKPFFGWGTAGAIDALDSNFLRVYQAHPSGWVITPHNTPLHVAVELGFIGLGFYVAAFVAAFLMLRVVPRLDRLWDIRVALTAALCALVFVGFFIDLESYKYVWLVLVTIAQLRTAVRMRAPAAVPAARPEPYVPRPAHRAIGA